MKNVIAAVYAGVCLLSFCESNTKPAFALT